MSDVATNAVQELIERVKRLKNKRALPMIAFAKELNMGDRYPVVWKWMEKGVTPKADGLKILEDWCNGQEKKGKRK